MKARPTIKPPSRHRFTRRVLIASAMAAMAAGDTIEANRILSMIGNDETKPSVSQAKKRRQQRQRWAAGDRHAFCRRH